MKAPPIPLLLALNIVLTVAAQSMLRAGMKHIHMDDSALRFIWRAATNGMVVGGIVIFGVSLLLWLALLSKMKLSILYPMQQGLVFIGIQIVAWKWLGEGVSLLRWAGVAVICLGVYLVSRG